MRGLLTSTSGHLRQLWYVPLLMFAMGLMFVRILVMARLFGTQNFGYFSAGLLISGTFSMLASLGFYLLLQREMPMMIVRNRLRAGVILLMQCILLTCVCVLVAMAVVVSGVQLAGLTVDISLVALLHGFSQQLFLIVTVESRSRGQSVRYAQQNFLRGIAVLTIGVMVCYMTVSPFYTLLAEAATTLLIVQGVLYSIFKSVSNKATTIYRIAFNRLKHLRWKSPLVLFVVSMVNYALINADKWIAAESQSTEKFALYAFVGTILLIAQSIQAVVNASIYPLLARRYASSGHRESYRLCCQISSALLVLSLILGLPICALLNVGIRRWFPAYVPGLELIPIFIGVAILRISDFWTSFMIVAGLETRLLLLNMAAIVGGTVFWLFWQHNNINLIEIGFLAIILSGSNYMLTTLAAWQTTRKI